MSVLPTSTSTLTCTSPTTPTHPHTPHNHNLYPSHPSPAPYHNHLLLKPFNFAYTGIFNILGNPVTQVNLYIVSLSSDQTCSQVPLGLNSEGLPLGVQVVAGRNMDRLCLAVAQEVQLMFGGWVPPSACHDKR